MNGIDWQLVVDQVKRAVPVREVLRLLDWRTYHGRRADCGLCKGSSRETIAFSDRLWRCHRCGEGGDVIRLVELGHDCRFLSALKFLAEHARIPMPQKMTAEEKRRIEEQCARRER